MTRRAKLIPWTNDSLTADVDFQQTEPNEEYFNVGPIFFDSLGSVSRDNRCPLTQAGRTNETIPSSDDYPVIDLAQLNRPIQVCTDVELVRDHLIDERFRIVDNQPDADIIFTRKHFKDFK